MTTPTQQPDGLTVEALREVLMGALSEFGTDARECSDPQLELDELTELVRALGRPVFWLDWDSGGPGGGAGTEYVYRVGDRYLVSSASFGWSGPFDSLEEAQPRIHVTGATRHIQCTEWSEDEILDRIKLIGEPPAVLIVDTEWSFEHLEQELQRRRAGVWKSHSPDASPGYDDGPDLIRAPALRTDDGCVFRAEPPEAPDHLPKGTFREGAWLVREGEAALRPETRDLPRAELRFRAALDLYLEQLEEPHPRLSYILDRIGMACHFQGRLVEAEVFYRRSLRMLEVQDDPTRWNEVTILNLAQLLGSLGRFDEQDAVMEWYQP